MPSFSNLISKLESQGLYYEKSPRHTTYNFNQGSQALYRNQPRLAFEYYVSINLNDVNVRGFGNTHDFIAGFFNNPDWAQVQPLVKSVDMPSFKIQTEAINQYNRKRLSQTRIDFDSIKMVMHDVADGKTLAFWEMYYTYYFGDGVEPGKNVVRSPEGDSGSIVTEHFLKDVSPSFNPNLDNLPASFKESMNGETFSGSPSPINQNGDKSSIQNIIAETLNNHSFGFNLPNVQNVRNLISSIDIYQVHGGRFNQVTLVNPRIASFNHDTLDYAGVDKALQLTFTFDYEYAYYTIQNLKLGGGEENNNSTINQYEHGEFLELRGLAFNPNLDFIESNNPLLQSDNMADALARNAQASIQSVTNSFSNENIIRRASASALDGMVNVAPPPYYPVSPPIIVTRPFKSVPTINSRAYIDISRVGKRTSIKGGIKISG